MMKIYTKTGDDGTTGLLGAQRVRKDDVRIEAYGEVDELNAALGVLLSQLPLSAQDLAPELTNIQNDLFAIGAQLATPAGTTKVLAVLDPARVHALEQSIDRMEKDLPPLKNFILPQGTGSCSFAHLARAIARRAERRVVALSGLDTVAPLILTHLNRLSDYLFVAARWLNKQDGGTEIPWITGNAGAAPAADRLETTLQKLEDEKKKRATLFERASSDLNRKKELAQKLFKQNVEQINKDGGKVEKPLRDVDLD
jgi:cob(I)alamin adenosyltransferase